MRAVRSRANLPTNKVAALSKGESYIKHIGSERVGAATGRLLPFSSFEATAIR